MNNRFIREKKDGQSQCYNCGVVSWHSFLYRDTFFYDNKDGSMVCDECKKLIEKGEPNTEIKWRGFEPKHREDNTK